MRPIPVLLIVLALAGCHRDKEKQPRTESRKPSARRDTVARKPVYPEADAVAILRAIDTAEITTSRVARELSQSDEVLRYAAVIMKDHSDLMHLVDSTGVLPRENLISGTIRRNADSTAKAMYTIQGGFNNYFMEQQVRLHQSALQEMDTAIIPSATSAKLRELLLAARPTIAAHLQRAMQIVAQRRKEAAERGEEYLIGQPGVQREPGTGLLGTPVRQTPERTQVPPSPDPSRLLGRDTVVSSTSNM